MAQWTLGAGHYIRPYRKSNGSALLRSLQCSTAAATATIIVGQVVSNNTVVSTSGLRIVRAPSSGGNGGNLLQVGVTSLLGVAMEADPSSGSTAGITGDQNARRIAVCVASHDQEFLGWCKGAGVVNSSCIGAERAIIFDSTLKLHFIDSTNSTAALMAAVVTDIPDWAIDSTNGPVVFKFLSSNVSPLVA